MERKIRFFCLILFIGSIVFSNELLNKFRVPLIIKGGLGFGYDSNFLRFSQKEIKSDKANQLGISSTIDSPILKPSIRLKYSPIILDQNNLNIISSIAYHYYTSSIKKTYIIFNASFELKLRSYSWIKFGFRDLPKYYLRSYYDRDLSNIDYYNCTFSSRKFYSSYSFPLKKFNKTWVRIYSDFTTEYYNPHFTEFDLRKYMIQADFNHRIKKNYKLKISIAHGVADNISYKSSIASTSFDRSYIFEKIRGDIVLNFQKIKLVDDFGITVQLEQRMYHLESIHSSIDNWKYYLDGRVRLWMNWNLINDIGLRTYYQFRSRDASSLTYGDFYWVEDVKSYYKHEFWIEFSTEFISDILY